LKTLFETHGIASVEDSLKTLFETRNKPNLKTLFETHGIASVEDSIGDTVGNPEQTQFEDTV